MTSAPQNSPLGYTTMLQISRNTEPEGTAPVFQLYLQPGTNHMIVRSFNGAEWGPEEHINPPLLIGVEYRTTERYLGKPVYVKCFDFGPLPNNTDLGKSHSVVGLTHGIRCELIGANDNSAMTHFGGITGIYNGAAELHISTNTNLSHISVNACIWYIKD